MDGGNGGMTRREALRKGAVAALWVAPAVQVLGMTQASADQPSGLRPGRRRRSGRRPHAGR